METDSKEYIVNTILELIKNYSFSKEEKTFLFWIRDYFTKRIAEDDTVICSMSKQNLKEYIESQAVIRKLRKELEELINSLEFSHLKAIIEENTLLKADLEKLSKKANQSVFKTLIEHIISRLQKLKK